MKRKRSGYVGFSLMTVSAALIGCERPDPDPPQRPGPTEASASETAPVAYASLEECRAQNSASECEAAFQQARSEHEQTAPRFADQTQCEQEWGEGNCESRPDQTRSGGSVFVPILAGFMLGRMMGGGGMFGAPVMRRGSGLYARGAPLAGGFARGGSVRPAPGPVQRGGFGQTSSYRGAGG